MSCQNRTCSFTIAISFFRNTVDGNPQWCCTYLLDPKDPLFVDVGEAFIKQQIKGILQRHKLLLVYLALYCKWIELF